MKKTILFCLTATLFAACAPKVAKTTLTNMKYPSIRRDEGQKDNFFGTEITDAYRWLEDANTPETKTFVADENKLTASVLDKIAFRPKVAERLEKVWNFERYGIPFKEGGKYYYWKNNGLQNQSVLYVQDNIGGESKVVLDPNGLSTNGTTSVDGITFSGDGRYMAYSLSDGGSDWRSVRVKDLTDGSTTQDELEWVKFSGMAWYQNGFFYSRYAAPTADDKLSHKNEYHSLYYHKLGNRQAQDVLIYVDKEHALRNVGAVVSDDERFIVLSQSESTSGEAVYVADLMAAPNLSALKFVPIAQSFANDYTFIDNNGDDLYFMTNNGAPNNRIVDIDFKNTKADNWKTIVRAAKEVMTSADMMGATLLCNYLKDASSYIKRYDVLGEAMGEVKLPGIGTAAGFGGRKGENERFYSFVSFTRPTTIYGFDAKKGTSTVFQAPKVDFDVDKFETKQVFFTGKDGTKVPLFISYKKGVVLNGNNPTWLYGYGGFNISITPSFSISKAVFMEQGGVYVVANIRGGGEYGEAWHKAGTKLQKQNVFDDFIGAAEFLIKEKYTNSKKLAIEGRSNGGLLVGACMTQRPDLYAVALPGVGVMDMLRYHKFTIGWAWASDYGKSDDTKEMFSYLHKYSPVHNCKPANYPSTMVVTADHDDRVVPAHSYKFIAALQAAQRGKKPTLIRIDTNAGHGAGKSTKMQITEAADIISFVLSEMGETFK